MYQVRIAAEHKQTAHQQGTEPRAIAKKDRGAVKKLSRRLAEGRLDSIFGACGNGVASDMAVLQHRGNKNHSLIVTNVARSLEGSALALQ